MSEKLSILFAPLDYHGHVNACHGIAQTLRDRGHRIIFAIEKKFENKLANDGFEVVTITGLWDEEEEKSDIDLTSKAVISCMDLFEQGSLAVAKDFCISAFENMYKNSRNKSSQYKRIIEKISPDIIVIDSYIGCPALTEANIPWVWIVSAAPLLALNNPSLPPPWSGFPSDGSNKDEWSEFRMKLEEIFQNLSTMIKGWYEEERSFIPIDSTLQTHPISPHLNIYMYPKELDYEQQLPDNWRRVDGLVRTTNDKFELPGSLANKPGKLVFLSMGSIGCSHIKLMQRLVSILAKANHRFIICKGPVGHMYELADNMWGQEFVPQTAVLPLVDLVISHGGNNTVTETFFFGKPMIIMPLFGDQYDNAQRIHETGLGIRLDPFKCSEQELLSSVEQMLEDEELEEKMKFIGERIRNNNDKEAIADIIEKLTS